ncbi:urease accessory protein UreD [Vogesella sp. XCS3]|uniref:urease accessory protein UreD n=1 Tax=Vogesella sp. XCS3 TaxID=2877939 RepID=UPI001D0B1F0E|nr:urease accessory protein UreD [Vogesella sp. XCS3]UDM17298.1 urease accessory protein UreD [Vogesella sp. XCS3]
MKPDAVAALLPPSLLQGWPASLQLAYARDGARTIPVLRRHSGPLRVQKHFIGADGSCEHIIVHPPGGVAGGDSLTLDIALQAGCEVLLTSPGAAKWYDGFGRQARQHISIRQASGSVLAWLPQETILFDGADVRFASCAQLAGDARLLWGDVVCLGRPAANLLYHCGCWRQQADIYRDGRLIYSERTVLPADSHLLHSPVGLAGHSVVATLLWAGPALPAELHDAVLALPLAGQAAASQLDDVWLARFVGDGAEAALAWLRAARHLIHPFTHGRPAHAPRIWAT